MANRRKAMYGDDGGGGGGVDQGHERSLPGAANRIEGTPDYKEQRRRERHRAMVAPLQGPQPIPGWTPPVPQGSATRRAPVESARAGGLDLRQIFTGSTLRGIIGLPTKMADVVLAKIKTPQGGGEVYAIAKDNRDVYIGFQDIISNLFGIGRLFAPGNALWRLPVQGDSAMVLKPSEADGTGVPYVMHGDGGSKQNVPAWLGPQDSGTSVPENWHIDAGGTIQIRSDMNQDGTQASTGATIYLKPGGTLAISAGAGVNVTIDTSSGGSVVLNGGSLAVARQTDPISSATAGPYPVTPQVIQSGAPFVKA